MEAKRKASYSASDERRLERTHGAHDHSHDHDDHGAVDTPLHRLPAFGAGLHRRRVAFVKATDETAIAGSKGTNGPLPGPDVADVYLRIVLGGDSRKEDTADTAASATTTTTTTTTTCTVCRLPLADASVPHDACLVHQVALGHARPPSALDRRRYGLAILTAQGWDPTPLQPRPRPERQGLGVAATTLASSSLSSSRNRKTAAAAAARASATAGQQQPRNRAHARLLRKQEEARRQHKAARLHEQIMGNRDLDKYLRPGRAADG
ncbi:hypothetical protein SPI_02892 [Niveomyces insectorum RCEF 264]|uniref:G-patch domain-containing protein n=1 Tax=Niveomyces insectorum RCEF 264 TaxID=1081102 RepID=A0A167WVX7_9HYPO|nr:hypothetical protein SPI_02892 [Niveomyces insectorum RCEF 264]